jgi:hypothetical protein
VGRPLVFGSRYKMPHYRSHLAHYPAHQPPKRTAVRQSTFAAQPPTSRMAQICDAPTLALLLLPAELRCKIYTDIFEDSHIAVAISNKPLCSTTGATTILRLCRFLRAEALPFCYALATFMIESDMNAGTWAPITGLWPSGCFVAFSSAKIQRALVTLPIPIMWHREPLHLVFNNLRYVTLSSSSSVVDHDSIRSSTRELLASEETRCAELGNIVRCVLNPSPGLAGLGYLGCTCLNAYVRRYYSGPVGANMALCTKLKPHPGRAEQQDLVCGHFSLPVLF